MTRPTALEERTHSIMRLLPPTFPHANIQRLRFLDKDNTQSFHVGFWQVVHREVIGEFVEDVGRLYRPGWRQLYGSPQEHIYQQTVDALTPALESENHKALMFGLVFFALRPFARDHDPLALSLSAHCDQKWREVFPKSPWLGAFHSDRLRRSPLPGEETVPPKDVHAAPARVIVDFIELSAWRAMHSAVWARVEFYRENVVPIR